MSRILMRWMVKGIAVLMLASCGDGDPAATSPQAKLMFADLNWSTARLQNAVARAILEKGYGYETELVPGGTVPLTQALIAGEINVSMEVFLPSSQTIWQEATAAGTVVPIGNSQENPSWESAFLIPQYTAEANPGLRSVEDLKLEEHRNLFVRPDSDGKAGLVTCLAGWECAAVNEKQVYGYGLRDVIHLITPRLLRGAELGNPGCVQEADGYPLLLLGPRGGADQTEHTVRRLLPAGRARLFR